ncbi:MAG TPA: phenylalanine--tRNA ligase subunit alpha [Tenericutes bacterium]|nr:phenylalanine--tRNA ligase subunit alpha [Mycoplasmatota bacterium]
MKEKIINLREEILNKLEAIEDLKTLNELKIMYLGKKGPIAGMSSIMGSLSIDEKKEFGKVLNELKNEVDNLFDNKKNELETIALNKKLESEKIDITLPSTRIKLGVPHYVERVVEEIEELFISMGYTVVEGPEVEKDLYNFELLNLPKGHPARDAQDTFYINPELLLRTQTSAVQARVMLSNEEKNPIRILCPGKTYRRDYDDATHGHQFTQIEALVVDKNISLANLKGTLDIMVKRLFGENAITRFRPSFYPFTEPSVEYDMSCFKCASEGCNVCKGTGWITIGGAGVVHPNVLRGCGYDPEKYTGFAFGFGIERICMLRYGITDLRVFYTNDLRNINDFRRKDAE